MFDLTITQQVSHDFIHPELTKCCISIELNFSAAFEKSFEKTYAHKLMGANEIYNLVQGCTLLRCMGVFAADNFPVSVSHNSCIIVNVSASQSIETL